MKILILSPDQSKNYNRGHQLFREEIARQEEVTFYGLGYKGYDPEKTVPDLVKDESFDLIMTYGLKYSLPFKGLGEVKVPKVHVVVDYHPWREQQQDEFLRKNDYALIFSRTSYAARALEGKGFKKVHVLPFSVDTEIFKNNGAEKSCDVSAILSEPVKSGLYPYRAKVKRLIENLDVGTFFTGNVYFDEYVEAINRTKIAVASVSKFRWLSMQYTEIMACGTFLLADWAEDLDLMWLEDRRHFVLYDGLNDLKKKIHYYLKNDMEREIIARCGMDLVRNVHSNRRRVETFVNTIKEELF